MNVNVVKLLLCLVLMSFFSSEQANAGGLSQGISRGDISEESSINDDEKIAEGHRQSADSSETHKLDRDRANESEMPMDLLMDFLRQLSFPQS